MQNAEPPAAVQDADAPGVPLRRLPAQQRNAIRVARILDAAGQLVAERGYEPTTTSHIARRAKCSPGVLYQLFADKRAIMKALSARNLDRYLTALRQVMARSDFDRWQDAIDPAIDLYVTMCKEDPGFRIVRFGDVVDVHLLDPERDNDSFLAGRLAELVVGDVGPSPDSQLQLAFVMAIKIADGLLQYAFARQPGGDQDVIDYTKVLLHKHFELALTPPHGAQDPAP